MLGLLLISGRVLARITVVNTGSLVSPITDDPKIAVLSFDAGATADKLIVQVSAEGQNVASITYQGAPLSPALGPAARNKGIFYLDNPFTGGAADLTGALAEGVTNRIDFGRYFMLHLIWCIHQDRTMNARLTPQARVNIEDMIDVKFNVNSTSADARAALFRSLAGNELFASTKTGCILATAHCEAVVQRVPEFVDPSDSPELTPVSNVNQLFGHALRMVSFRWLAPSEI